MVAGLGYSVRMRVQNNILGLRIGSIVVGNRDWVGPCSGGIPSILEDPGLHAERGFRLGSMFLSPLCSQNHDPLHLIPGSHGHLVGLVKDYFPEPVILPWNSRALFSGASNLTFFLLFKLHSFTMSVIMPASFWTRQASMCNETQDRQYQAIPG